MAERVGGDRPDSPAHSPTADEQAALDDIASRRFRVALVLTAAMMAVYFGFILLVAFGKEFLGELLVDGLSVGILLGVLVILSTWVLMWVYVRWANRRYEPAVEKLRR